MEILFNSSVLASMLRIATPLTLAAIGCLLCQRAGIVNFAMEGFMLVGAFVGVAAVVYSKGNVWIGFLFAMLSGGLMSALFALSVVNFKANQVISGIAINLLSSGLTTYLLRTVFHVLGTLRADGIKKLPIIDLPFLDKIPLIGKALNHQTIIVYLAIVLIIITYIILFKTELGLNIRAQGESEDAIRTAGINPKKIQWGVILTSGALSGLAGAYLSTVIVSAFTIDMIQGRGFNTFTAVVFGAAHPIAVWLVTLLFGYADAVGIQIELLSTGISPAIVKMFPYVLAIVALTISSGTSMNRNNGKPGWFKTLFGRVFHKKIPAVNDGNESGK
jgi:general nucleoside transport system permease protein